MTRERIQYRHGENVTIFRAIPIEEIVQEIVLSFPSVFFLKKNTFFSSKSRHLTTCTKIRTLSSPSLGNVTAYIRGKTFGKFGKVRRQRFSAIIVDLRRWSHKCMFTDAGFCN